MMISMQFLFSLAACAILVLANAIPEPVITPAPIAGRQAFEDSLIGYYSYANNLFDSAECPFGSTWTASSTYGRCCATTKICTAADYITRCAGNSIVFADGLQASCTGSFGICNTDQIIQTINDANPTFWIGCDDDGLQTFYYRTMPGAATESPITTTTKPPVVTDPTSTQPPTRTTTSPVTVETTVPIAESNQGKSKAFIAGVVVGPVAALAIIGLLVWIFFLKRSKRKDQIAQQYQAQQQMAPAPQQYQQPPPQDPRYSAAPTYSNVSYQGSYQQPTVYSPGVSTMSSPQMPYTENVAATQHHGAEGYFSPDAKTPAVTTSQQNASPPPPAAPYKYPPHSELQ